MSKHWRWSRWGLRGCREICGGWWRCCWGLIRGEVVPGRVSSWLIFRDWGFAEGGSRDSPRLARHFFFASPKKSTQKKGDPQSATPSLCEGANLRRVGCGVRRRTHFALARSVQTTAASQFTKHGRFDAHAHPATAPPQAQPAGGEHPNSHSGLRCARPSMRCALRKALAPTTQGRAKQWPEWLFGCPSPLYAPRSAAASGSGLAIV